MMPAPYLPSIIQRVSLSREESRETRRDSGEFGKLCSRHRYPAQRDVLSWHWDTRYGAPWYICGKYLVHTYTPARGAADAFCVEGGEERGGSSKKREERERERERESEARRYLRRIILHYVPKRRTNAVLIYASPRGDKRKAGEIGVSRAGDQLFLKVCAPTRFAIGIPRTMLELLRPRISSKGLFSLRFLCARSINNSRFRRSGGVAARCSLTVHAIRG